MPWDRTQARRLASRLCLCGHGRRRRAPGAGDCRGRSRDGARARIRRPRARARVVVGHSRRPSGRPDHLHNNEDRADSRRHPGRFAAPRRTRTRAPPRVPAPGQAGAPHRRAAPARL